MPSMSYFLSGREFSVVETNTYKKERKLAEKDPPERK